MLDQANGLRALVEQGNSPARLRGVAPPRMIVVSGGKGGVGGTTVSVNQIGRAHV